jgi:hypothetical protein
VGVALWLSGGLAAWALARIVPPRGGRRPVVELLFALGAALLLGVAATALDFGGWNEMDWRAGLFVLLGALAAVGVTRAAGLRKPKTEP